MALCWMTLPSSPLIHCRSPLSCPSTALQASRMRGSTRQRAQHVAVVSINPECTYALPVKRERCNCSQSVMRVQAGSVRRPVTQDGRDDAQGLRSVNAIFHHHYQMSHRPKIVCSHFTKRCCPHSKQLSVCEPPQHMRLLWGGTIHPKWNKICM